MSEKIMHYCLLGLAVCLGGYLMARGFLYLREDSSESAHEILGTLCEYMAEDALELCLPQYMGCEMEESFWEEQNVMGNLSALVQYIQNNSIPETAVEDEKITNEIVKLHNKLLLDEVLLENQITKNDGQEQAEDTEDLPAWAQITENTVKNTISLESLKNFNSLIQQFFVVDADTSVNSELFSVDELVGEDMTMEKKDAPQILIYHTHSQEGYVDSIPGDEETTVVGVGNYLASLLEDVFGYQVIHVKDEFDMTEGQLERSRAYNYALPVIEQVLEENPTIEVVIDLHRDGVNENTHLVTEINGKQTAKIMFFNGLSRNSEGEARSSIPNPYMTENLAFSFQLSYEAESYYPDFVRCVYLKGYRYNLHVRPKSILLEVGAQTNTVEEAKNAMEPFSAILNKVLNEE